MKLNDKKQDLLSWFEYLSGFYNQDLEVFRKSPEDDLYTLCKRMSAWMTVTTVALSNPVHNAPLLHVSLEDIKQSNMLLNDMFVNIYRRVNVLNGDLLGLRLLELDLRDLTKKLNVEYQDPLLQILVGSDALSFKEAQKLNKLASK